MEELLVVVLAFHVRIQIAIVVGADLVIRTAHHLVLWDCFLGFTLRHAYNDFIANTRSRANFCADCSLQDHRISLG